MRLLIKFSKQYSQMIESVTSALVGVLVFKVFIANFVIKYIKYIYFVMLKKSRIWMP